jgi:elongation factor P hydroxylase
VPDNRLAVDGEAGGEHHAGDLCSVFDQQFRGSCQTCLLGEGAEPVYLPADSEHPLHRLVFRLDYFASALHEIAHWCIAGEQRRTQVDYGYWYHADGRSASQQASFENIEAKPQALEWIFAKACNFQFRPSADNLNGEQIDDSGFKQAICVQAHRFCRLGLPHRAAQFRLALCQFYGVSTQLEASKFHVNAL